MLWRLLRARPIRGAAADIFNQVSFLAVVSACLAATVFSVSNLGRHFGVLRTDPLATFASPGRAIDEANKAEAGIAPPQPVAAVPAVIPGVTPSPESFDAAPLPTYYQLNHSVGAGTWLPILMYHYIRKVSKYDTLGWNLSVTPDDFRAQVNWLSEHGYTTITMHDADLILAGKKALPQKPVALTFDDGYRDFYTTAAPILRQAGFTATSYIPTQLVGGADYMSWPEIQQLDSEGFEMGAHTQSHADLGKVTLDRARIEIYGSKAELESNLGHQVFDFAYPYGSVTVATARLVRDAGFWSATTTQPGAWHEPTQMLYLSRVRMGGAQSGVDALSWSISQPSAGETPGMSTPGSTRPKVKPSPRR